MSIVSIKDLGLHLPKWTEKLDSINWEDCVIFKKSNAEIILCCEKTWWYITLILDSDNPLNITAFKCQSKNEKGICIGVNWPRDNNWNKTNCNIKI